MSWSPVTSRVRRHIAHHGFDAQKQWVISYSPWVALAIVFPETPAQMFDPWRSLSFIGLCQIAGVWSPKRDKGFFFFFLVTGLKRQQRDHCDSRAGEQFFQYLPEFNTIWLLTLNQITKVTGSPYDKLQINIILIPYCLTDINQTNHCWFNLLRNLCTDYRYEGHGTGGLYLSLGLSWRMCLSAM